MTAKAVPLRTLPFLIALCMLVPAFARGGPADILGGKTVHVQLAIDDFDSLLIRNTRQPAKRTSGNWHSLTFPPGPLDTSREFSFVNRQGLRFLSKEGLGTTERTRFHLDDFQGKDTLWIVVDPSGPIWDPPVILLEPPRIVNILNPWPTTAPLLVLPGGAKKMLARPDRCGWFMAFLLKPVDMALHFREINGNDSYGTGGLGSTGNFDMAAQFAAKGTPGALGTHLWLDTESNAWSATSPAKEGICSYVLAATVRDFSSAHPDFDFGSRITGDFSAPGMLEPILPASDRLPVRSAKPATVNGLNIFNDFDSWWKTDSTNATPALRSYETCVDIPLSKTDDGQWEYRSFRNPSRGFWPVNDFSNPNNEPKMACANNPSQPDQWFTNLPLANMSFCMESHASFIYQPGQKFMFRGDDDVWIYIDGKLVIDLGGIHIPQSDTVFLDQLNLAAGREYAWDLFYCDRQPCGSALDMKTSIYFKQQRALEAEADPAKPGTFRIVKREGGKTSCSGTQGNTLLVPATNLVYELWDASGKRVDSLAHGSHYGGGVIIAAAPPEPASQVTVDTLKVAGFLPAGSYRIVAFEPGRPHIRAEIPFRLGPTTSLRPRTGILPRLRQPALHDALGRARNHRGAPAFLRPRSSRNPNP